MSEGFPPDTPASLIWEAALFRRETKRAWMEALSVSICNGVQAAVLGGDTTGIFQPFYTDSEWEKKLQAWEDDRQRVAQQQQLAKIMRMTNDRGIEDQGRR